MADRVSHLDRGTCRICRCSIALSGDGTVRRHISQVQQGWCRGSGYEPQEVRSRWPT